MEIRQLRAFKAVSTFLSFNKAARYLNYAQSSISAQIKALEDELDVRLFDRLGRGIRLTEAGERLGQYTEKILDLEQESRAEISGTKEIRGSLTIRIPESVGVYRLPHVIQPFVMRFPKVRLSFTTCAHEALQKDLRKGITDLAFLLTESIEASDLETEAMGFESIVMVAAPQHRLTKQKTIRSRDLAEETILLSKVDCSYRRTFERLLHEAGATPRRVHLFHSVETMKHCVMSGAGITVIPRIAVEQDLARGDLIVLNWEEKEFDVALLMIWYKERWRSPAVESFMAMTREVLTANYGV